MGLGQYGASCNTICFNGKTVIDMKLFILVMSVVTFIILLVFAFLSYPERTLSLDLAFQDFYLILTKSFVVNLRFGTIIPQVFPLAFIWMSGSLKQILLAHSI